MAVLGTNNNFRQEEQLFLDQYSRPLTRFYLENVDQQHLFNMSDDLNLKKVESLSQNLLIFNTNQNLEGQIEIQILKNINKFA